jgi:hypothetical protein
MTQPSPDAKLVNKLEAALPLRWKAHVLLYTGWHATRPSNGDDKMTSWHATCTSNGDDRARAGMPHVQAMVM